jgi:hypothetical protein
MDPAVAPPGKRDERPACGIKADETGGQRCQALLPVDDPQGVPFLWSIDREETKLNPGGFGRRPPEQHRPDRVSPIKAVEQGDLILDRPRVARESGNAHVAACDLGNQTLDGFDL